MYLETEETIKALKAEVARLKAALEEVVLRCRTKISMKQVTRKALYDRKD